MQNTHMYC